MSVTAGKAPDWWVCQVCGKPISPTGAGGFIEVMNANPKLKVVGTYPVQATPAFEPPQGKGGKDGFMTISAADMATAFEAYEEQGPNIDFCVYHAGTCDEHPETEGYVINVSRAATLADWNGWVLHLFDKNWMGRDDLKRMMEFWWSHKNATVPDP